jgi:hypothetical protein
MTLELEKKLTDRWPTWFHTAGDLRHTLMPLGFQCGDGWFGILWSLCARLDHLMETEGGVGSEQFEVLEVKEKFGGLRFYVNHLSEAIDAAIEAAKLESLGTCELCGRRGQLRTTPQYRTLCDEHVAEECGQERE